jgi:hypothetical protein
MRVVATIGRCARGGVRSADDMAWTRGPTPASTSPDRARAGRGATGSRGRNRPCPSRRYTRIAAGRDEGTGQEGSVRVTRRQVGRFLPTGRVEPGRSRIRVPLPRTACACPVRSDRGGCASGKIGPQRGLADRVPGGPPGRSGTGDGRHGLGDGGARVRLPVPTDRSRIDGRRRPDRSGPDDRWPAGREPHRPEGDHAGAHRSDEGEGDEGRCRSTECDHGAESRPAATSVAFVATTVVVPLDLLPAGGVPRSVHTTLPVGGAVFKSSRRARHGPSSP